MNHFVAYRPESGPDKFTTAHDLFLRWPRISGAASFAWSFYERISRPLVINQENIT
jgi:hypothetical protein